MAAGAVAGLSHLGALVAEPRLRTRATDCDRCHRPARFLLGNGRYGSFLCHLLALLSGEFDRHDVACLVRAAGCWSLPRTVPRTGQRKLMVLRGNVCLRRGRAAGASVYGVCAGFCYYSGGVVVEP